MTRFLLFGFLVFLFNLHFALAATVRGKIIDAETQQLLAARIYIQASDGKWLFPKSSAENGSAIEYQKQRGIRSVEMHTALSAHPFEVDLPPGEYTITVVRGKEYRELTQKIDVADEPLDLQLPIERWINLAEAGWFSGDTHVHRTVDELRTLVLAEDLNVALPLTYWVTKAYHTPSQGARSTGNAIPAELVEVAPNHVIWPRNTEFEFFTVDGERHTLGAVFVLNHHEALDIAAPPVKPIGAARDADDGVLLELDKHNWPWSMALMPLIDVDLFELSNNHVWRTEFAFKDFAEPAPDWMNVDYDDQNGTEDGWLNFGFENYYALLNCGFDMNPTAGTANGVHPVPLGFGRVYVQMDGGLNYDEWIDGLGAGRSFVTTGPMLFAEVNGEHPGKRWRENDHANIEGTVKSTHEIDRIEILFNGRVIETIKPDSAAAELDFKYEVKVNLPGWFVVRCFENRPNGRTRFAHTAPWHFEFDGRQIAPRREQINYLIQRVQDQIERSKSVLTKDAIDEYREALKAYKEIAKRVD
ncbi:MAG: CehA/McbA family metallohydrolase [Verrucomicrobiota bacterium]